MDWTYENAQVPDYEIPYTHVSKPLAAQSTMRLRFFFFLPPIIYGNSPVSIK